MTPEERELLDRFLQDLGQARAGPKDAEAERLIRDAFSRNADAAYLLVQHAVLADQSLHAAQARIAELEQQAQAAGQSSGSSFLGGGWRPQTAVPASQPQPAYQSAPAPSYAASPSYSAPPGPFSMNGGLGSFLRNAGTTAAGVAGGEMLFEGLSGLFGGHRGMFGGGWGGGWPGGGGWGGGPTEEVIVNNNYYDDDDDVGSSF